MPRTSFRTVCDQVVSAVTADEMRAVDRVAMEDVGLELLQMMENAGRILASHVRDVADGDVVVMAGNGGNGGGGLACARHLVNHGESVRVVLDRAPDALTGAAARQYSILDEMRVETTVGRPRHDEDTEPSVLVDALIGYGLTGDVREPARGLIEWMIRREELTVSLDVPSGVDATTGAVLGVSVDPVRTVTLALPKTGLDEVSGTLFLADIGIPTTVYDRLDIAYETPFRTNDWVELSR